MNERKTQLSVTQMILRGSLIMGAFFLFGYWYLNVIPQYLSQFKWAPKAQSAEEAVVNAHRVSELESIRQKVNALPKKD